MESLFPLLSPPSIYRHACKPTHSRAHPLPSYMWYKDPLCRKKKVKQWNVPTEALPVVSAWSADLLCLRDGCQATNPNLFYTWLLQRTLPDTLGSASPEQGSDTGSLLDAAWCMAQGTVEWFSVRHEPVCSWRLGEGAAFSLLHIWESTWLHPQNAKPKGESALIRTPSGLAR